jgi:hypothetical protein
MFDTTRSFGAASMMFWLIRTPAGMTPSTSRIAAASRSAGMGSSTRWTWTSQCCEI